ncbi:MAG: acyl-CoA dehydrogenase family protein [Nitrospirota bacterium]
MSELLPGLEKLEEARERMAAPSFMAGLFLGRPDFTLLLPPEEPAEEREAEAAYCVRIEAFLRSQVDPEEIERTGKIPDTVLRGLFDLGAFALKIPREYGGLGFSYTTYGRVLTLIAGWSNSLALTVAVPQSIGIAMPILLFGNEEQKKIYLPRVARDAVSAFALTEPITGSDAANVQTEAVLDETGAQFTVNGEKLWCTNGPLARYVTLIARVPARRESRGGGQVWIPVPAGKAADDRVHTAFILDMTAPGVTVRQRCQFEGCRGIENAHMTFTDVRIPAANVIGEVGKGLKYALTILNVGRAVSIPAICLGMAKQAWQPTLDWANSRVTFGKPLGERQTQRMRAGRMAAALFAMEALATLVWRMADHKRGDIRIEAAVAKMFCSESTIQFLKDAQTLFGGMGYETAASKRLRGEPAFPIEQLVRDAEMYRIGEGATDILRPFVAREGLNQHLDRAKPYFAARATSGAKLGELLKLVRFYLPWYLSQWRRRPLPDRAELRHPKVRGYLAYVERESRRLARAIFYAMARYRAALRDDQGRQNRIEAVGEDLLAIAATALSAESRERTDGDATGWMLADEFFRQARERVDRAVRGLLCNDDHVPTGIGGQAVRGAFAWLSRGIIRRGLGEYAPSETQGNAEPPGDSASRSDSRPRVSA